MINRLVATFIVCSSWTVSAEVNFLEYSWGPHKGTQTNVYKGDKAAALAAFKESNARNLPDQYKWTHGCAKKGGWFVILEQLEDRNANSPGIGADWFSRHTVTLCGQPSRRAALSAAFAQCQKKWPDCSKEQAFDVFSGYDDGYDDDVYQNPSAVGCGSYNYTSRGAIGNPECGWSEKYDSPRSGRPRS
jgi:hypothetical protein